MFFESTVPTSHFTEFATLRGHFVRLGGCGFVAAGAFGTMRGTNFFGGFGNTLIFADCDDFFFLGGDTGVDSQGKTFVLERYICIYRYVSFDLHVHT